MKSQIVGRYMILLCFVYSHVYIHYWFILYNCIYFFNCLFQIFFFPIFLYVLPCTLLLGLLLMVRTDSFFSLWCFFVCYSYLINYVPHLAPNVSWAVVPFCSMFAYVFKRGEVHHTSLKAS